mmetsp:Transcript_20241/g.37610  ORF Transcript_20241/g.37610 Transcript_20241/m.37610 type:complete len:195 (-) Transcript_20241:87-671(-)
MAARPEYSEEESTVDGDNELDEAERRAEFHYWAYQNVDGAINLARLTLEEADEELYATRRRPSAVRETLLRAQQMINNGLQKALRHVNYVIKVDRQNTKDAEERRKLREERDDESEESVDTVTIRNLLGTDSLSPDYTQEFAAASGYQNYDDTDSSEEGDSWRGAEFSEEDEEISKLQTQMELNDARKRRSAGS